MKSETKRGEQEKTKNYKYFKGEQKETKKLSSKKDQDRCTRAKGKRSLK